MLKLILAVSIIGYSILIKLMLELMREMQTIRKILWEVAQNESLDFIFKDSNKNSKNPVHKS